MTAYSYSWPASSLAAAAFNLEKAAPEEPEPEPEPEQEPEPEFEEEPGEETEEEAPEEELSEELEQETEQAPEEEPSEELEQETEQAPEEEASEELEQETEQAPEEEPGEELEQETEQAPEEEAGEEPEQETEQAPEEEPSEEPEQETEQAPEEEPEEVPEAFSLISLQADEGGTTHTLKVEFAYTLTYDQPEHCTVTVLRDSTTDNVTDQKVNSGDIVRKGDVLAFQFESEVYTLDETKMEWTGVDTISGKYTVTAEIGDENPKFSIPAEALSLARTVAAPTFQPAPGALEDGYVTITCATEGAQIWYKPSNSNSFRQYNNQPILVSGETTFEAYAKKDLYNDSEHTTATYTLANTVAAPVFSVPGGEVEYGTQVELTCATEGAEIYYSTVSTSNPTTKYEGPISIVGNTTLYAAARKTGWNTSEVVSQQYTLTGLHTLTVDTTAEGYNGNRIQPKGGTLQIGTATVAAGQPATVTITAQTGYVLTRMYYTYTGPDGQPVEVEIELDTATSGTFTMPDADMTVKAEFMKLPDKTVRIQTAEGGTVATTPSSPVPPRNKIEVLPTPSEGYRIGVVYYAEFDEENVDISAVQDTDWVLLPYSSYPGGYLFTPKDSTQTVWIKVDFRKNDPVSIGTKDELMAFAAETNKGDHYEGVAVSLTADIALDSSWTPITDFRGTFDGGNHTVTLADAGNGELSSLFNTATGAAIKNVQTAGNVCGPALLYSGISVTIENCVNYADSVGYDRYKNGYAVAAGIAGSNSEGTITGCVNYGDIVGAYIVYEGADYYGGMAAGICCMTGRIIQCANYGDIYGGDTGVAGANGSRALGYAKYEIRECVNRGNLVIGGTQYNSFAMDTPGNGTIEDCYNTGSITVVGGGQIGIPNVVGGLSASRVANSYTIGSLSAPGPAQSESLAGTKINIILSDIYCGNVDGVVNSYGRDAESITAALLNAGRTGAEAKWQDDVNNINGGYPLLAWESNEASSETYKVTFTVNPADAEVAVYKGSEKVDPEPDGSWALTQGVYSYTVEKVGYISQFGTFNVVRKDVSVPAISLSRGVTATFRVSPSGSAFSMTDPSGAVVDVGTPTTENGADVYTLFLAAGQTYTYLAAKDGYNSESHDYNVPEDVDTDSVTVALETSSFGKPDSGSGEAAKYIYGSWTDGKTAKDYTITTGGTYSIDPSAKGIIYIDTAQTVTLVGRGGKTTAGMYEYLYIDCIKEGVDLILEDLYIHNDDDNIGTGMGENYSVIDFTGTGNSLRFSGTCTLDWDGNITGKAAIHVPTGVGLTISGVSKYDTLYLYKHEQGAGIGGDGSTTGGSSEYNGDITIGQGIYFIKGSKQGATIGSGAYAGTMQGEPGSITIQSGAVINGIQVSRGAFIGGAAGGNAAVGADVTIESGASINIHVDYTGAAIGGGGYKSGNDQQDGGTVTYYGGSIRTFVGYNAINPGQTAGDNFDGSLWSDQGVTEMGVNAGVITADLFNKNGKKVYPFVLDTEQLNSTSSTYTVKDGSTTIYSGGLHEYCFKYQDLQKSDQPSISYTWDNWVALDDPNLYLFLTGEDHTLTVGKNSVEVTWDEENEIFSYVVKDTQTGEIIGSGGTAAVKPGETEELVTTVLENKEATVTVSSGALAVQLAEMKEDEDKEAVVVIEVEIPEGETAERVTVVLTVSDTDAIAEAGAILKTVTPLAEITLSNDALKAIGKQEENGSAQVTVSVSVQEESGTVAIEVAVNGEAMEYVAPSGILVTLPVAEEAASAGSVLVMVDAEGKETVIRKSVLGEGSITALLDGSCTLKVVDNAVSFPDVTEEDWFADAIAFVTAHELFIGEETGLFNPEGEMTRAMLVTVLHRLENTPDSDAEHAFGDIPDDEWFADSVRWAAENSIVIGYSDDVFAPDDSITREQIVVIMYRYANLLGLDVSGRSDVLHFTDIGDMSDWAADAMEWALASGLILGNEDGTLNPAGNATRAEVAIIIQRLIGQMMQVS